MLSDYGRKDKNGNERELHIAKVLDVTNTTAIEQRELNIPVPEGILKGIHKFFTATYVCVEGESVFKKDYGSFRCFTCLEGKGRIGNVAITKGDSVFVPAGHEDFVIAGNFNAIMTTVRKYRLINEKEEFRVENDLGDILAIGDCPEDLLGRCGLNKSDIE